MRLSVCVCAEQIFTFSVNHNIGHITHTQSSFGFLRKREREEEVYFVIIPSGTHLHLTMLKFFSLNRLIKNLEINLLLLLHALHEYHNTTTKLLLGRNRLACRIINETKQSQGAK